MAKPTRWRADKRYLIVKVTLSQKEPAGQNPVAPHCAHRAGLPALPSTPLRPVSKSPPESFHATLRSADRVLKELPFDRKIGYLPYRRIHPRSDSRQEPVIVLGYREITPFLFFHHNRDAAVFM